MPLALPDTVTVLGADIPFWYAAGGFVLLLVAMGGEHQNTCRYVCFRSNRIQFAIYLFLNHAVIAPEARVACGNDL